MRRLIAAFLLLAGSHSAGADGISSGSSPPSPRASIVFGTKPYLSSAPFGWPFAQQADTNRIQAVSSPSRYATGFPNTLQFQVQPGDSVASGARAEVLTDYVAPGNVIPMGEGSTGFYCVSVYLPQDFVAPFQGGSPFGMVMQAHGPNTGAFASLSPTFRLSPGSDAAYPGEWSVKIIGGDVGGPTTQVYDAGPIQLSTWVDWCFNATWSATGTGSIGIYKRIVGTDPTLTLLTTITGANLYSSLGVAGTDYMKTGIYQAPQDYTVTVFQGPFAYAADLQTAATQAFGRYP